MSKVTFLPLGLLLVGVSLGAASDAGARALHGRLDGNFGHTSGQIPKLWRQPAPVAPINWSASPHQDRALAAISASNLQALKGNSHENLGMGGADGVVFSISTSAVQAAGNGGAGGGDVHARWQSQEQRFAGGRGGISGEVYLPPKGHGLFAGGRGDVRRHGQRSDRGGN